MIQARGRPASRSAFVAAILLAIALCAFADSSAALKDAQSRLGKAASPAEYSSLLDSLSSSLPPADAIALLSMGASAIPEAQRSPFLIRSGDLSLLLGLFADAQARYEEASALASGGSDSGLLLRAARCALASGDPEKARAISADLIIGSSDQATAASARLVGAWALLAEDRDLDARAVAAAIIDAGVSKIPADKRREARFILWLVAGGGKGNGAEKEAAAKALAAEFPGSPEALIASGAASAPALPHWYLGGLGSGLGRGDIPGQAKPKAADKAAPAAVDAPMPSAPAAPPSTQTATQAKRLQVGYFSVEENAKALREELAAKGYSAKVEERMRPGKTGEAAIKRWIVAVDGGKDLAKTMQALKDSGYESYIIE